MSGTFGALRRIGHKSAHISQSSLQTPLPGHRLMQSKYKHKLSNDHGESLEQHGLLARVSQVLNLEHLGIEVLCDLTEEPLEAGKERRIVKGPFRCLFVVPLLYGEGVCDGEPVSVNLEIGGLARWNGVSRE